jgi:hypothetical protein
MRKLLPIEWWVYAGHITEPYNMKYIFFGPLMIGCFTEPKPYTFQLGFAVYPVERCLWIGIERLMPYLKLLGPKHSITCPINCPACASKEEIK